MNSLVIAALRKDRRRNIALYGGGKSQLGMGDVNTRGLTIIELEDNKDPLLQATQNRIDAIIVMKQLIFRQDIFRKLLDYCDQYQAGLYDIQGRRLDVICREIELIGGNPIKKEILLHEIEQYEYISFDIFDTLLMRKVLMPEDVFELVSRKLEEEGTPIKHFKEKRIKSQEKFGLTNPTIYDIYGEFEKIYNIAPELSKHCIELELEIETNVLIPRKEVLDVFYECIKRGKVVSLITDMYIPEIMLKPILQLKGIEGYQKLYISCDCKQLKLQGLFDTYRNGKVKGKRYLHIGDHKIHDGICARLAGIDICLLESSYKMAVRTIFNESIQKAWSIEERLMLGLVISKCLNSPFERVQKENILIYSDYDFCYSFCAAIISQFALWIYEMVKRERVDNILFASRDGYLIQKIYRMISEYSKEIVPKGVYFYTSRKASVMTCVNNEAYVNMLINIVPNMPPQKLMRECFGLEAKDTLKYDKELYGDSIHAYVWKHIDAIWARANKAKHNYFRYMSNIALQIGKKYAFMDFVSSGTSQKSLMKIVPFQLVGFYAGWNGNERKEEINVKALFDDSNSFFLQHYKLIETFMTSDEPSLRHFNENGLPVFSYEDRNKDEMEYIKEMQQACMDYFKEILILITPKLSAIKKDFTDSVFAASTIAIVKDSNSMLNHLSLMDDWSKRRSKVDRMRK